jgi:hypothetical protein
MHFLNPKGGRDIGGRALWKLRACVTVRVEFRDRKPVLVVKPGSVSLLKGDAVLTELPKEISVIDEDGKRIKATGKFYVTTETFDPYHCVTDLSD